MINQINTISSFISVCRNVQWRCFLSILNIHIIMHVHGKLNKNPPPPKKKIAREKSITMCPWITFQYDGIRCVLCIPPLHDGVMCTVLQYREDTILDVSASWTTDKSGSVCIIVDTYGFSSQGYLKDIKYLYQSYFEFSNAFFTIFLFQIMIQAIFTC